MPLLRLAASRGAGLGSFSPVSRDHSEESGHWFEAQTLDSLSSRETGQGQGLSAVGTTQPAPGEGTEGPGQTWGHHKTHSLYPRATLVSLITLAARPPCSPNLDPGSKLPLKHPLPGA